MLTSVQVDKISRLIMGKIKIGFNCCLIAGILIDFFFFFFFKMFVE